MDLPLLVVPLTDCPTCGDALASHPADGCSCSVLSCSERATTRVSRNARFGALPYCDAHARMHAAQAERFGYPIVLQAMPSDVPLRFA